LGERAARHRFVGEEVMAVFWSKRAQIGENPGIFVKIYFAVWGEPED
jgi:hypothetical protein